jgi:Zn-finger nucleic acid-binding protein/DNA-directed RNA polymerase subunit RPC12/RpoP
MSDAIALDCSKCGAPVLHDQPGQAVPCTFCGTMVTRPVQKVVERVVERVVVAATAPAGARPAKPGEAMMCPRCQLPLFRGQDDSVILHGCGRCGGIWLDNASGQALVKRSETSTIELVERAGARARFDAERHPPVACPVCAAACARVVLDKGDAVVDVCGEHGTWFDRYELALVAHAYLTRPPLAAAKPASDAAFEVPDFRKTDWANSDVAAIGKGILLAVGLAAGLAGGAASPRK